MELEAILVLVLSAGVLAMLAWFEINSRRNDARMKQRPELTESASGLLSELKQYPIWHGKQESRIGLANILESEGSPS